QETCTAPAKLAHRTRQQPRPKAATGTDAQTTNTCLRALSYPYLPTAPHVYRMFHRCNRGRLIIAITRWSILGDDLRDRHAPPLAGGRYATSTRSMAQATIERGPTTA